MGITVQKLSAGLDCGNPIVEKTVSINSKDSLSSLRRRVFLYGESMMHEALLKVRNPAFEPQDITDFGKVYTIPNLRQWVTLNAKIWFRKIKFFSFKKED